MNRNSSHNFLHAGPINAGPFTARHAACSQFCVQITVVGCHSNKGQSGENVNDTIRSADPENPQFGANSVHVSSKVPELWLLEVAIGRNAIFHILGEKYGKC